MRVAIFDLETSSLYADTGILLCAVVKEFGKCYKPKVFRADNYPQWETNRSNTEPIVRDVLKYLEDFDIFIAHNGQYFDKAILTSWALKFGIRPSLRFEKFIDPVMLARRHMRISRRSLASILQFLDIPEEKTAILWKHWMLATIEGNKKSLNYIVEHCIIDVLALERAYEKTHRLVKGIDERGSAF